MWELRHGKTRMETAERSRDWLVTLGEILEMAKRSKRNMENWAKSCVFQKLVAWAARKQEPPWKRPWIGEKFSLLSSVLSSHLSFPCWKCLKMIFNYSHTSSLLGNSTSQPHLNSCEKLMRDCCSLPVLDIFLEITRSWSWLVQSRQNWWFFLIECK